MTTPSAVDEWKCGFCESSVGYEVVEQCKNCGEQWSHQCDSDIQPVSDAEVSALEGRLAANKSVPPEAQLDHMTYAMRDAIALLRRRTAGADVRDVAIGRLVREKLVSGNAVPVWHCTIRADEVAAIDAAAPPAAGEKTT